MFRQGVGSYNLFIPDSHPGGMLHLRTLGAFSLLRADGSPITVQRRPFALFPLSALKLRRAKREAKYLRQLAGSFRRAAVHRRHTGERIGALVQNLAGLR